MSSGTLYDKVWDLHRVAELPGGSTQLFVGLHLIHEVTSPQAFAALEEKGLQVHSPDRTIATVDHIVPTTNQIRPFAEPLPENVSDANDAIFGSSPSYDINYLSFIFISTIFTL